jgi:Bacterial SH3 domain
MLSLMATWHFACSSQSAMNDKQTWWQVLPMGKKGSIFVGVIAFALIVFLAWNAFWTPNDRDSLALQQQEEKIRDMEDRVGRLQKELEESSRQIASLQAGSDETTRARRSAPRRINNSRREETRLADQNPSPDGRSYQTVRSTSVFEEPSASSRKVGSIPNGTKVRVVGSTGDWLEVRSKQGRPPGFIQRDDAVLMR